MIGLLVTHLGTWPISHALVVKGPSTANLLDCWQAAKLQGLPMRSEAMSIEAVRPYQWTGSIKRKGRR